MTEKRQAILAAAKSLFSENSYHSTGVDKIAAVSGASKMTLYSQFGSKEQLIVEVLRLRDEEFIASLRQAMDKASPGLARLAAIFEWHGAWFRQPDFHGCLFIKASQEFAGQSELIMAASRTHKALILGLIERCLVEAAVQEPSAQARLLFTLIEGMIVSAQMFGPDSGMLLGWPQIEAMLKKQSVCHAVTDL